MFPPPSTWNEPQLIHRLRRQRSVVIGLIRAELAAALGRFGPGCSLLQRWDSWDPCLPGAGPAAPEDAEAALTRPRAMELADGSGKRPVR